MTTKYVLAPVYHIVFRDALGNPAANGTVETFLATDHGTQKAVYEDEDGTIPFPNPINLNAAGVVADALGAPKPIYWADDANYYVVVKDCDGNEIQTIDNYNAPSSSDTPSSSEVDYTNYILNPQFRFYIQQEFNSNDPVEGNELPQNTETLIANEGWFFDRNNNNSTMTITFEEFTNGQTDVPDFPVNYLRQTTTSYGAGSESLKDVVFPINGAGTFANEEIIISFWAKAQTIGDAGTIILSYEQDFGTGGSPSTDNKIIIDNIPLTTSWNQYEKTVTVQNINGKTFGTNGDDRFLIRITYPLDQVSRIDMVNMQLNRGGTLLAFNYRSYELEASQKRALTLPDPTDDDIFGKIKWDGVKYVIDNETGKVEAFLFGDTPDGFLPMDGSTVVRTAKVGSTKIKYNRLYQAWENDSIISNGNAFGYGSDGFFPALYTNNALFTIQGVGSVTDWVDSATAPTGFTFAKIQDAASIGFSAEEESDTTDFVVTNSANGVVTAATIGTTTFTLNILQQGTASLPEITQFIPKSALEITTGSYFLISAVGTDYYVWFKKDLSGVDPAIGGRTGVEIGVSTGDSASFVAKSISDALDDLAGFGSVTSVLNTTRITNLAVGVVTAPTAGTTPFTVHISQTGTVSLPEIVDVAFVDASLLSGGDYWEISSSTTNYYFWYKIDGVGTDPAVGGRTGVLVELLSTDTALLVELRTIFSLNGKQTEKVTTTAASSLSGGEYFEANNVATPFYVWYDLDDGSTDPKPIGKTGIEVDISTGDTDAQVAQKTSKAISSYYYVIPDYRGYFFRVWANGSSNDPEALLRLNRGDGIGGDTPGTIQRDQFRSHSHKYGGYIYERGDGSSPSPLANGSNNTTQLTGGSETRPLNAYLAYFIKY